MQVDNHSKEVEYTLLTIMVKPNVARQANLCLRAFRYDKF